MVTELPAAQPTGVEQLVFSKSAGKIPVNMAEKLAAVRQAIGQVMQGHQSVVQLVLAAILARGHVLLEDVPGVGKTTLARTFAAVLGLPFGRIQFTADMLPSDVVGGLVLDKQGGQLTFRPGPIFTSVVLADEINRASPKTQSAMLEAMAERKVTVDNQTYPLPDIFTVLATQNPIEHHGAYPLPESQLDRFMICTSLGYPTAQQERTLLLKPEQPSLALQTLESVLNNSWILEFQQAVQQVIIAEPVADYMLAIVRATRDRSQIAVGVSPRGAIALATLSRAWALLAGVTFVRPDDVQAVARAALAHRLVLLQQEERSQQVAEQAIADILEEIAPPR